MFSKDNTSTFVELLQSIEKSTREIAKTSVSFQELKNFQFGLDFQRGIFPYLVVLPLRETIIRYYTGNLCEVERAFRFEIHTLKPQQETAFGQATGLINNIRLLYSQKSKNSFWRFKSLTTGEYIVFNSKVDNIRYEDPLRMEKGIHCIASVDITFTSMIDIELIKHLYPTEELSVSTSQKEIIKILFEIIDNRKLQIFPEVKQIRYGIVDPLTRYPGVVVTSDNAEVQQKFAGANLLSTDLNIFVYSSLMNEQNSIYENMHIIDKIRSLVISNKYLLNRCYDYSIRMTQFGIQVGKDLTFYSQLTINTKSLDLI